jgi:hypothetical protein
MGSKRNTQNPSGEKLKRDIIKSSKDHDPLQRFYEALNELMRGKDKITLDAFELMRAHLDIMKNLMPTYRSNHEHYPVAHYKDLKISKYVTRASNYSLPKNKTCLVSIERIKEMPSHYHKSTKMPLLFIMFGVQNPSKSIINELKNI